MRLTALYPTITEVARLTIATDYYWPGDWPKDRSISMPLFGIRMASAQLVNRDLKIAKRAKAAAILLYRAIALVTFVPLLGVIGIAVAYVFSILATIIDDTADWADRIADMHGVITTGLKSQLAEITAA
ncbi:hypothetical protein [Phenylobacterium sp.]|uniref:hypothetical protein n=1 Tax=Phenylobacterium sp. TaxID=1871053 RepID=UPI0027377D15|nr:hypothetical protein [Phenylobacterium sp.]MDP3869906.1 hypothetical protein [Phenylobacterium sp.]